MSKILVIAPYSGLKDLFVEINQELNKDMEIYKGNLHEGVKLLNSLNKQDYDVIISRGATSRLLREQSLIPVIDVKISGYDILRALTLVKDYSGSIGIMSYLNVIQGADSVGKLLDMNLKFYPINTEKEIESRINNAANDGIKVMIGDVISTSMAVQFGLHGILITSGKEAVIEAIYDAEHLVYYMEKQVNYYSRYISLIEEMDFPIIIFDTNEDIQYMSSKFKKLIGKKMTYEGLYSQLESNLNDNFNNEEWTNHYLSKYPLEYLGKEIGSAFVLSENTKKIISPQVQKSTPTEQTLTLHFNHLVSGSHRMMEVVQKAKKLINNDVPVLIYGEQGSGKKSLAQSIHNEGIWRQGYFNVIICNNIKNSKISNYFHDEQSLFDYFCNLGTKGTIFFQDINLLPIEYQIMLTNTINLSSGEFRVIASTMNDLKIKIKNGTFSEELFNLFKDVIVQVPPLRERLDDINDLTRWFIASMNPKLGKQIVGIKEKVLLIMKGYSWPGNIRELKNVTEQMCLLSKGPFIEEEDIQPILIQLKDSKVDTPSHTVNYQNKTLEQIEIEIIKSLMEEEDYNQSEVARRLGINRTTLWRKLKNE